MGIMKALANREFEDPEFRASLFSRGNTPHQQPNTMSRDEQTTIGAILEMTPGDKDNPAWVNGEFAATVTDLATRQTKTGQTMFTGTLADADTGAQIAFSCFGRKVFPPAGSEVLIGGQGISLGEYNGNPQLTFGQKATINKTGGNPAPMGQKPPPRANTPPARQNGSAGQGGAYVGEAVGHAISNAALDLRELSNNPDHDILADHDAVGKWVWQRASVYLRVADALKAGKLCAAGAEAAPNPRPAQPAPPPRQEPPRRPAPTQSGAAFEDAGDEQDVQF